MSGNMPYDLALKFQDYSADIVMIMYSLLHVCMLWSCEFEHKSHHDDVIMGAMGSQVTSLTIVYSTVYSGADQSKHQSSASLAFVWGIHRDRWIPRTNGQ